jgi:hypothetical protein
MNVDVMLCKCVVQIGVSLDETVSAKDMEDLMYVFCCSDEVKVSLGPFSLLFVPPHLVESTSHLTWLSQCPTSPG